MKRFLAALCLAAGIANAQVAFKPLAFPDALKQAGSLNRGVMIAFYTDWCYWCKVMDGRTFSDAAVANFANAKFVALKINAEKGEGVTLDQKYAVHGYPTVLFLDDEGRELYRVAGYEPPEKFLQSMNTASMGSMKQLEENLARRPDDAQATYALAQKCAMKGDDDRALDLYRKVVTLDPDNKRQLAEVAALAVAQHESKSDSGRALEAFVHDYPNAHSITDVSYELSLRMLSRGDDNLAEHYFTIAAESSPNQAELLNGFAWQCAGRHANLIRALRHAQDAVSFAMNPTQQATYLDTEAQVYAALGEPADAARCLHDAIALLTGEGRNDKLLAELRTRLSSFEGAK